MQGWPIEPKLGIESIEYVAPLKSIASQGRSDRFKLATYPKLPLEKVFKCLDGSALSKKIMVELKLLNNSKDNESDNDGISNLILIRNTVFKVDFSFQNVNQVLLALCNMVLGYSFYSSMYSML